MPRQVLLSLALLCLLAPASSRGASDWTKIKAGITPFQAADVLGPPLIRTYGRGFQVWIYDSRGEIVFAGGPAMGWTPPVPNPESASRPVELDVLIRPLVRLPALRSLDPQRAIQEDPFDTRFRYKR